MAKEGREIRPLVAGNWKMNGHKASVAEALAVKDALLGPLGFRCRRCDAGASGDAYRRICGGPR